MLVGELYYIVKSFIKVTKVIKVKVTFESDAHDMSNFSIYINFIVARILKLFKYRNLDICNLQPDTEF